MIIHSDICLFETLSKKIRFLMKIDSVLFIFSLISFSFFFHFIILQYFNLNYFPYTLSNN